MRCSVAVFIGTRTSFLSHHETSETLIEICFSWCPEGFFTPPNLVDTASVEEDGAHFMHELQRNSRSCSEQEIFCFTSDHSNFSRRSPKRRWMDFHSHCLSFRFDPKSSGAPLRKTLDYKKNRRQQTTTTILMVGSELHCRRVVDLLRYIEILRCEHNAGPFDAAWISRLY